MNNLKLYEESYSISDFEGSKKLEIFDTEDEGTMNIPNIGNYLPKEPIPVAVRSKAWVCGCSIAGLVGSNPAGEMDVCLL
jgi:uncharacterized membrane protein